MADIKISALKEKKAIKPIVDGVLIPASVLESGKYVSGAIDTTDMADYVAKKLDNRYDLKGSGVSVNNVRPGAGISVTAHEDGGVVIANTLTHSLYTVVDTLPETGEDDKIYVVPSTNKGESNSFVEYAFINGAWEKLGEHATTVTLPDNLATKKDVEDAIKGIEQYDDTDVKDRLTSLETKSADYLTADDIKNKVDKVEGKGLSTEDFTTTEKTKLANIEAGAQKNTVLSVNGDTGAITGLAKTSDIPTKVSQLTNDSGYLTEHQDISGKVDVVEGKGLSTEDFTTALKTKLAGIADGADISPVKSVNGETGVVNIKLPTKLSELTNDANFITEHQSLIEYDKAAVADTKYLKIADYTIDGEFILVKKSDLTAITDRIKALEDKFAIYDDRFGYPETTNGDWTTSFLIVD